MGSGVLLAALVVLWFVVLVPMVVTRGDGSSRTAAPDSGRTLQRRRAADPVVHAETERVSIDRAQLRSSGELQVDVHALRRRTLAGLVALAVLALVGALAWRSWMWAPQVLLDVAVVGYLMVTRAAAQRERRAAARRAARAAHRPVRRPAPRAEGRPSARPATGWDDVRPAAAVVPSQAPAAQHPSLPLAPVHPLRPGRVVAARTPAPAGWQHSAVVGLDDDDIGFADVDVYQPRRVANG
ncbi:MULTISPECIES: divisome protein SepX/GlpR [unclassified Modestobacter]